MEQLQGIKLRRFKKALKKSGLEIILVLENLQYARNVAEVFRIADALKVKEVALTGVSQTPPFGKDLQKVSRFKELAVKWKKFATSGMAIQEYRKQNYQAIALELTDTAIPVNEYRSTGTGKVVLLVGSEVYGINKGTLEKVDAAVYIPMYGKGASLNVAVSVGICLYTMLFNN